MGTFGYFWFVGGTFGYSLVPKEIIRTNQEMLGNGQKMSGNYPNGLEMFKKCPKFQEMFRIWLGNCWKWSRNVSKWPGTCQELVRKCQEMVSKCQEMV